MYSRVLLILVTLILSVIFVSSAVAQGDLPEFCVCQHDNSCSGYNCNEREDCGGLTFTTPAYSGNYHVRAKLVCDDPEKGCGNCVACVYVLQEGSLLQSCHTTCQANDCENDQCLDVYLEASKEYTLVVCLQACEDDELCPDCDEYECTAYGYVYTSVFNTSCWGIVCN